MSGKVRIIHGTEDDIVFVSHGLRCLDILEAGDATMIVIKHADHMLDRPNDLVEISNQLRSLE